MNNSELWKNYQNACNDYLQAFCLKHNFDFEDAKSSWVSDIPGTIVMVGDYYFSMETIITDINEDVPEHVLFQWYDYSLEDGCNMNYQTWLNFDKEEHEKYLENLHKKVEQTEQIFLDKVGKHVLNSN